MGWIGETWATVASVIGFVVLVAGAYLSWLSYRRDSSKLELEAEFKRETGQGTAIEIRLRNNGRYPVYIEHINLILRSKKRIPFVDGRKQKLNSPLVVTDGKPVTENFALCRDLPDIKTPKAIKAIEIIDSQGRTYRYPRWGKTWWRFRKQIEQRWTPEQEAYWAQQNKQ